MIQEVRGRKSFIEKNKLVAKNGCVTIAFLNCVPMQELKIFQKPFKHFKSISFPILQSIRSGCANILS